MGKTTISWCDFTFNGFIGCSKVKDSPACNNCYAAEMDAKRFSKTLGGGTKENPISHWGPGAPRYRTSESAWKAPYAWNRHGEWFGDCIWCGYTGPNEDRIARCGRCSRADLYNHRKPRVFSLSLGDWLDDEVPIEWLADMLKVIHDCQNLTWLLLTKRPANWKSRLDACLDAPAKGQWSLGRQTAEFIDDWIKGIAPRNVHIGITAEDQFNYDRRLPHFLEIPATSRFLSIEPMCGKIALSLNGIVTSAAKYHQVIVGGESGDHWKDNILNLDHMRDVFDQCRTYHVKRFAKQDSARLPGQRGRIPDDLWVQEFPV